MYSNLGIRRSIERALYNSSVLQNPPLAPNAKNLGKLIN